VQFQYNAHGYQHKLVEATNPAHVYQQVNNTNAFGQVTSESLHDAQFQLSRSYHQQTGLVSNITATSTYALPRTLMNVSYVFDAIGNLSSRTRQVQAQSPLPAKTLQETFTYDQLNRLTQIAPKLNNVAQPNQTLSYDLLGNITNKSGVGAYTYTPTRPHAVASAAGSNYSYDSVGNMTSGGGRTTTYTAFRKPVLITKGNASTQFAYGPDRSYYLRLDTTSATSNGVTTTKTTKTRYVGNVELIAETTLISSSSGSSSNTVSKTKRYIGGSIIVTDKAANGSTPALHEEHALFTDHLGSTAAVAKANSLDYTQQDYDAFGKRRSLWTIAELTDAEKLNLNSLTTTGFTGHEMMDEVGLIHMQGRVYDPNLGRFMSADPYITELDNTQNMNRYSYVYNNPMNATDPSGFAEEGLEEGASATYPYSEEELYMQELANQMAMINSWAMGMAVFGSYSLFQLDPFVIINQNAAMSWAATNAGMVLGPSSSSRIPQTTTAPPSVAGADTRPLTGPSATQEPVCPGCEEITITGKRVSPPPIVISTNTTVESNAANVLGQVATNVQLAGAGTGVANAEEESGDKTVDIVSDLDTLLTALGISFDVKKSAFEKMSLLSVNEGLKTLAKYADKFATGFIYVGTSLSLAQVVGESIKGDYINAGAEAGEASFGIAILFLGAPGAVAGTSYFILDVTGATDEISGALSNAGCNIAGGCFAGIDSNGNVLVTPGVFK
jgi:RHS repeat-associated protein